MSDLAFPEILDAPTAVATVPASLKSTVLAQFTATETSLVALAAKYANVAYAVQTPKGLTEAKAARHELREQGRYLVERAEKRIKAEVNDLKKTVADEVERLVAIVRPAEDAIDAQIKAREEQIAAEKAEGERKAAEAARIEADRKQRLEDGIATLAGYVQKAEGKTAAQIAGGIDFVRQIRIDADHWQEYTERAAATLAATLQRLEGMHAAQVQAERDAAELAALRAERAAREAEDALVRSLHDNARRIEGRAVAYVQKAIAYFESGAKDWQDDERPRVREAVNEGRRHLTAALAEAMDREAAEAQAERDAAAVREATRLEAESLAAEHEELERERIADLTAGAPKPGDDEDPAEPAPAPLVQEPTILPAVLPPEIPGIRLGAINAAVGNGFAMTEAFVSTVLGVSPDGRDKSAVLYTATSRRAIMAALIKRLQEVA